MHRILVLTFFAFCLSSNLFSQDYIAESKMLSNDSFSLQQQWNIGDSIGTNSLAGVLMFDDTLWITNWFEDSIYILDKSGRLVESFTIQGVKKIRSLTSDGQHIFAGTAKQVIYKIDPVRRILEDSLILNTGIINARMCAYDPSAFGGTGGFWLGDFGSGICLVEKTGGIPQVSISSAQLGITGIYGGAVDIYSQGGPFLYIYAQSGNTTYERNTLHQFDITTLDTTGIQFNVNEILGPSGDTAIAGGAYITADVEDGSTSILVLNQQSPSKLLALKLDSIDPVDTFELISPQIDSLIYFEEDSFTNLEFNWSSAGDSIFYQLQFESTNFSTAPVQFFYSESNGLDTLLSFDFNQMKGLVNAMNLQNEDTIEIMWTVKARKDAVEWQFPTKSFYFTVINNQVVGLIKNIDSQRLVIYPNPSEDVFSINQHADVLQIFDAQGRLILELKDVEARGEILIGNLKSGLYSVRIIQEKSIQSNILIKQ